MKNKMTIKQLLELLQKENIHTWFDLGLFMDRFKEEHVAERKKISESLDQFKAQSGKGGMAFITFHYMVDGVTVEIGKYAKLFEKNIPGIPIHYIAGTFRSESETLINANYRKYKISEIAGFDEWVLYEDLFLTELERGSKEYNELILKLWAQCLVIIEKLGSYIEKEGINLLYLVNICSNPGNVAASLALVLLSEFLGIPVINNNHDFYWEGGNNKFERKVKGLMPGPRDFFFTNAHLGEVFSLIEVLYPWESRNWINVNINRTQSKHLIRYKGHNPASVLEIGTTVDTGEYTKIDKQRSINAYIQFKKILACYKSQLICYSVEDVKSGSLVSATNPKPILIGHKTRPVDKFISENIIFLQPTRIISRKRIEMGFNFLQNMLESETMKKRLLNTPNLKITLVITGPIATGQYEYYKKLIKNFKKLLNELPVEFSNRVFLALLLGELDRKTFLKNFENPVGIPELYKIASLILLPSKTEGRGLPIIEAAACGTPIFCRRYEPEEVYSEVIGEHLGEKDRLRVFDFTGKKISNQIVERIIDRVFFPHKYTDEIKHNKRVVEKRYSLDFLNNNIQKILARLFRQLKSSREERVISIRAILEYEEKNRFSNNDLEFLLHTQNRQYLPGYGRLAFMNMLKSLIDPSFFRIEQQRVRGMSFYFAMEILNNDPGINYISEEKIVKFYNTLDEIFKIREGEISIRHDHSMSYRHRNKYNYPYQQFTFQEFTGLINSLYRTIIQSTPQMKVDLSPRFFTDWNFTLLLLSTSNYLAIDNRKELIAKLKENIPIAYFPGENIKYELDFFCLQVIRSRMKLPIENAVTWDVLEAYKELITPVYIFAQEKKIGSQLSKEEIQNYIVYGKSEELKLLLKYKLVRIVPTEQLCVGIHFPQLGAKSLAILREIRKQGGFLLTNRRHAALMTDIVNIDRFHIGSTKADFAANVMGIPVNSGYIQYVPAGLRTTLGYPAPVQTAKDFNDAFNSNLYLSLVKELGEATVMDALVKDAEERGSPIMHVLEELKEKDKAPMPVRYEYVSGVYDDGMPYSGAIATLNTHEKNWSFAALGVKSEPKTVSDFVNDFESRTGEKSEIAWNGGYILNPELVGHLGLPELYIGSPLGLLISNGECLCPPLFNKAALLIDRKGNVAIQKVNCSMGIVLEGLDWKIDMGPEQYNVENPGNEAVYYDLMYAHKTISGNGRTIIRFSGNIIKEMLQTKRGEAVEIIPAGITVLIPASQVPVSLKEETKVKMSIKGMEDTLHAIEAGPFLLYEGELAIDMESEGWKTENSIATQAARIDYIDMRGPKIAVGINETGDLAVLTINGRIRESVGATHIDMGNILKKYGMTNALGFDPGGSSTLVIEGKTINISPYNLKYEENIFSLRPEPRAVSNAIIGYIKKD